MTCRRAALEDVPRLVHLAQCEHARSKFKAEPFDTEHVTANFVNAVQEMRTCVFISDSGFGFIVGIVQPSLMNRQWKAYELAWYSEDGGGMVLLRAFLKWASKLRVTDVVVSNYSGIGDAEKFARAMKRIGFDTLGPTYTMKLKGA